MGYSPQTELKLAVLARIQERHSDWGASKLERAVFAETGSRLHKQTLLKEAASNRARLGGEAPLAAHKRERRVEKLLRQGQLEDWEKVRFREQIARLRTAEAKQSFVYSPAFEQAVMGRVAARVDDRKLESVLRLGGYTDYEKAQFREQIDRYSAEGRHNFIHSPTFEAAARAHAQWLAGMMKDALKLTKGNRQEAEELLYERLARLHSAGEYDPFKLLREQEQAGAVISGTIKVRALRRDYTDARREQARQHRQLVREKMLARR